MHTYYLAVTIGMQDPEAADDGPVGDGVVVETHDPITTRNGLAEALSAVGRLLKADPAMIVILHHFELNGTPTQLPTYPAPTELWREQILTNDQVMAVRSLLQKAYGYGSGGPLAPDETRWVEMLPVWLRNAIVSGVA